MPTQRLEHELEANGPADNVEEKPYDGDAGAAAKPVGPPNGGIQAWLQVASAFVLFFNIWYSIIHVKKKIMSLTLYHRGLMNTFGVYQSYYESGVPFTSNSSDISWTGSV